ncbi:unnamed protein product, partial [marine sediment metagenome]
LIPIDSAKQFALISKELYLHRQVFAGKILVDPLTHLLQNV